MKIFLGILGVAALIGICFGSLAVYAKKEINKPKFEMPGQVEIKAKSPLPETREEAFDYAYNLFSSCLASDDIELSEHTYINLTSGESVTPFSQDGNKVFSRMLEQAQGKLTGLYKSTENVLVSKLKNAPSFCFTKSDVEDFTAEKGVTNENGETNDDGYYYITLTVKPDDVDMSSVLDSEVEKSIIKELEPMLKVASCDAVLDGFTAFFKIDYSDDSLVYVEFKQNLKIKASVDFNDEYKVLSDKTSEFMIPAEKKKCIDFFHYGLNFSERQIAVQLGDTAALPLDVRVNSETTKENYSLSFKVSDDKILSIDADGVMEAVGSSEKPVTVTATLEYDGHTYTDELIVYATELEVKRDEP